MHPFRFGVSTVTPTTADELQDLARKAEHLGYDVLAIPDHVLPGLLSPFAALGAAAAVTTTLKLGTLVLNNDLRHPALAAREAASLDLLSGGRVELGLGAGHGWPEYEALGLPFDPAPTRIERLDEAASIVVRLLRGESVTHDGTHYRLRDHTLWPPPTRQPRIPLLIGGFGERLLRVAARHAGIVGFTGVGRTLEDGRSHDPAGFAAPAVDARVALVREAAGDRLPDLEFHALVQTVVITEDRERAAQELMEKLGGLSAADIVSSPFVLVGTVEQIVEELRGHRERFGISYYTVFDRDLERLAPVVRVLAGT
jgi:probable F420-dependent oxidoreductase